MSYLCITNQGEMDPNALFLLGASSKEGDESKIGFFGSGNKYALACLLRKGVEFHIFSGSRKVEMEIKEVEFRGQTVQQIYIDGEKTSFTTRMGPTWEVWMALREFVCNARDEGGYDLVTVISMEQFNTWEGYTRIFISMDNHYVAEFYESLNGFILQDVPLESLETRWGTVELLSRAENEEFRLYRKGIRCNESTDVKSVFNYNFDQISINESRVIQNDYETNYRIACALAALQDEQKIRQYLEIANDEENKYVEHDATWYADGLKFSSAWEKLLTGRTVYKVSIVEHVPPGDTYDQWVLPDRLVDALAKQFPALDIFGKNNQSYFLLEMSALEDAAIKEAVKEVVSFGYHEAADLEYFVVKFFNPRVLAQYQGGKCYLSRDNRSWEHTDLVKTIIEERAHHIGYPDGTREFENYLMHELIKHARNRKPDAAPESMKIPCRFDSGSPQSRP